MTDITRTSEGHTNALGSSVISDLFQILRDGRPRTRTEARPTLRSRRHSSLHRSRWLHRRPSLQSRRLRLRPLQLR